MDTDSAGQDNGMLRAYGLVYALLRSGVPVYWAINPSKSENGDDFAITASGALQDVRNGASVAPRTYRGGPFLISSVDAVAALPIITAWQATVADQTAVHRVTAVSFDAPISRTLIAAPRIAIFKDGNETVAFNDLNAAGITDSAGAAWSSASSDLLSEATVAGSADLRDGALFDANGLPRYCHFASMHYNAGTSTNDVVAEVRAWLDSSSLVDSYMQCEAARTFENASSGHFLTNFGLDDDGLASTNPAVRVPAHPVAQIDGTFEVDVGSLDSMKANAGAGSLYKTGVTTLINDSSAVLTDRIILLTGRLDGANDNGRVTYLGGHDYTVDLPVTSNPQTNGVRLMLNALLQADCAATTIQSDMELSLTAPASITNSDIAYTVSYTNPPAASRSAESVKLVVTLPVGVTYVVGSASVPPTTVASGRLTWNLPSVAPAAGGSIVFHGTASADGTYTATGALSFSHVQVRQVTSSVSTTRDTAPLPIVVFSQANPTVSSTLTPAFTFLVDYDGPTTAYCSVAGDPFVACSSPFMTRTLPGGNYTLSVFAQDGGGRQGPTASFDFVIDVVPPLISIPAPPNQNIVSTRTPAFTFADVSLSGTAVSFECRVDSGATSPCVSPFAVAASANLSDGSHTLYVSATDLAGNFSQSSFAFTIDTVAPLVSIPGAPINTDAFASSTPTVFFNIANTPGTTPIISSVCSIYNAAPPNSLRATSAPLGLCDTMFTVSPDNALSDGAYLFEVIVTDAAGNVARALHGFSFAVDTSAPVLTIFPPPYMPHSRVSSPTFEFSVDPGGTPVATSCRVYVPLSAPPAAVSCTSPFMIPMPLVDGHYVFEVIGTDGAGNVSSAYYYFHVDTVPPSSTITRLGSTPSSPQVMFVLTSDEVASFECNLDDTGFLPCLSSFTTPPLADGEHTLAVRAIDLSGNVEPVPEIETWEVAAVAATPTPTSSRAPTPTPTFNAAELCNGGPYFCKQAGVTSLTIRNSSLDKRDRFTFRWKLGDETTGGELGDPRVDTGYAVCVWDTVSGTPTLVMAMAANSGGNCAGKPCWHSLSGKNLRYRYQDSGLLPHGIQRLTIGSGPLGIANVTVTGRGVPLPDPPMPFRDDPTITVRVINGLGTCWGADYVLPPRTNTDTKLMLKEKP